MLAEIIAMEKLSFVEKMDAMKQILITAFGEDFGNQMMSNQTNPQQNEYVINSAGAELNSVIVVPPDNGQTLNIGDMIEMDVDSEVNVIETAVISPPKEIRFDIALEKSAEPLPTKELHFDIKVLACPLKYNFSILM